jgi:hypothetical protein
MKKKKPKSIHSSSSRGTTLVGRVNPDLTVFVWDLAEAEVRMVAESLSKSIEVSYQMELIQRSGFGHESD